jgi:hypothetical protein
VLNITLFEQTAKEICYFAVIIKMKRLFSILMTMIILASGVQVFIDRHYCGGEFAGSKLSLSGKLASCGMEASAPLQSDQPSIDNKCCEDQLSYFGISSKYLPEYFRLSSPDPVKAISTLITNSCLHSSSDICNLRSWVLPPGDPLISEVKLSGLCVYRI